MHFDILTTERLTLRVINPEVCDFVFANYSDEELQGFFGLQDIEAVQAEKERHSKGLRTFNKSFLYFHLLHKQTGVNIGWCGYHTWYLDHQRAEIGYMLNSDEVNNKGFMGEAIEPVIAYGFGQMKLNRVEAFVGPGNTPSLKLLSKMGFVKEGHLRSHYFKKGIAEDSLVFSILKEEYALKEGGEKAL